MPLPVVLPFATSCTLYVSVDAIQSANFFGPWETIVIPAVPGLAGFTMHLQAWTTFGFPVLEASDAATLIVGN